MMFRRVNKQPGIQKILNLYGPYQDIYDWISPLNKRSGIYSNTAVYGEKWELYVWSLAYLRFLKHLILLLRCISFRASFLLLIKDTAGSM